MLALGWEPHPATDSSPPSADRMRILVANLGSTSFKFRLFHLDGSSETMLAKGGYERVTDYGRAIDGCLSELRSGGHLASASELAGVGFKTVLGRNLSGCVPADDIALAAMEGYSDVAPAHNHAYVAGIRRFREKMPGIPLVALFETAFYQWVPEAGRRYAVPEAWYQAGVRRFGFHGASHKFVAERSAELLGREDVAQVVRVLYQRGPQAVAGPSLRVISCHLGGSSSITGMRDGVAVGTSMGMSPQSGVPQNNRVGDLDTAAIPFAQRALGLTLDEAERQLTKEGGLLGLSGLSNDVRDIKAAAAAGSPRAQLALDVYVHEIRRWIGSFYLQLNGCDALVFTAGIGENNADLRAAICAQLDSLGIVLDHEKNAAAAGREGDISAAGSRVRILIIPANEELVVARETRRLLKSTSRA